jgi:hypothetical protein
LIEGLTERWRRHEFHAEQNSVWSCGKRFVVIEAGRRSGKTSLAKMDGWRSALRSRQDGWLGVFAAPTRDQAKGIFWEDLKAMAPSWAVSSISESELRIGLINGASLRVVGMDRPQRIEGMPVDKIWLDELADLRPNVWDRTIRPLLSTKGRRGRAWLFGVPRPSSQFQTLADFARDPKNRDEWAYFHWTSIGVVDAAEIASARAQMDPVIFAQEYEATRANFQGRAYYRLDRNTHARFELQRDTNRTLYLCFDFNVSPGVCCAVQELPPPKAARDLYGSRILDVVTSGVGEVFIPRHSNSERVAQKALEMWGDHTGYVELHGDASGGANKTSGVLGSDWDLIDRILRRKFGSRLRRGYPNSNPLVRTRVNAVNARLQNADDKIGTLLCPSKTPRLIEDLDMTMVLEGTAGEIDKSDPARTHMSDAFGGFVVQKHPCYSFGVGVKPLEI